MRESSCSILLKIESLARLSDTGLEEHTHLDIQRRPHELKLVGSTQHVGVVLNVPVVKYWLSRDGFIVIYLGTRFPPDVALAIFGMGEQQIESERRRVTLRDA